MKFASALFSLALVLTTLGSSTPVASAQTPAPSRAAWMRPARWGVMTHFLADGPARTDGKPMSIERWNDLIDHFDVETLADQLKSTGAGYHLISLGQNSGYYLSPNSTYDRITGLAPSKCSRRDLVADLATALARRGLKLLVYLPSGAPSADAAARQALRWENGPHRHSDFQNKWEAIISEWSLRWGNKVSGWWFDGCSWPNTMYRTEDLPNFLTFAGAARCGNPLAAVAFSPGVIDRTLSLTPHEDYLAGAIDQPARWNPEHATDGLADGAQVHVLSYLGEKWGLGAPRFTDEQAVAFSQKVAAAQGVITWDAPVQNNGTLAPAFLGQLRAVGVALKK